MRQNKLNDLDSKEWLKFTKTWFVHHPKARKETDKLHPAKFPESLVEQFISFFTKRGETVLDPFLGTGSTLVACDETGRKGIGVELAEKYAVIARKRTKQRVIVGDSLKIDTLVHDTVDFVITSPPYGPMLNKKGLAQNKRKEEKLDTRYSDDALDLGNVADYGLFVDSLCTVFKKIKPLLREGKYLVIILQNYRDGKIYRPLAWDVARGLSQDYMLVGERIWCFHPETLIWTSEGVKQIQQIKINDLVLTHAGTFEPVKQKFKRDYSGPLFGITVRGLNRSVFCTPEHKILVIRRKFWKKSHCFERFKDVIKKKPQWVEAFDLKIGDLLLLPIPHVTPSSLRLNLSLYTSKKIWISDGFFSTLNKGGQTKLPLEIDITPDFCRLAGYYISEGHGSSRVALSISSYNKEIREDIIYCFNQVFPGIHLHETSKEVLCYSRLLSEIFANLFGSHAKGKKIPPLLLNTHLNNLAELLKGLWAGDGCISSQRAAYKTISPLLAHSLTFVLLRFKLIPNVQFQTDGIQLSFRGKSIEILAEILKTNGIKVLRKKYNNQTWRDALYFYLPIRKIEEKKYTGSVYNLMIEPHNTYVTYSFSSHNCQDDKTLYPYGMGNAYVPNVHHHICLILRK